MTFLTLTTSLTHPLLLEQLDFNVPWGLNSLLSSNVLFVLFCFWTASGKCPDSKTLIFRGCLVIFLPEKLGL